MAETLPRCASRSIGSRLPYANGERPTELSDEVRSQLAGAHVLLGFAEQFPDLGTLAPQLCWFHQGGAGYEKVELDTLSRHGIGFVSAAGAGATGIAEFVVLAMLSLARRASDYYRAQQDRQWQRFPSAELAGRRLTVVGAGEIGSRVCRLGAALGLEVTCVRLHPELGPPDGASRVVGPAAFASMLPVSDVMVLAAPLTDETNLLLGGAEMAALPAGALIVNVARAGLIDHGALREASGRGTAGGRLARRAARGAVAPAQWSVGRAGPLDQHAQCGGHGLVSGQPGTPVRHGPSRSGSRAARSLTRCSMCPRSRRMWRRRSLHTRVAVAPKCAERSSSVYLVTWPMVSAAT